MREAKSLLYAALFMPQKHEFRISAKVAIGTVTISDSLMTALKGVSARLLAAASVKCPSITNCE